MILGVHGVNTANAQKAMNSRISFKSYCEKYEWFEQCRELIELVALGRVSISICGTIFFYSKYFVVCFGDDLQEHLQTILLVLCRAGFLLHF